MAVPAQGAKPLIEVMLTTCPERRARIPGSTAWIMAIAPNRSTSNSAPRLSEGGLLDRAEKSIARVVDQPIDPSQQVFHHCHGLRGSVRHSQVQKYTLGSAPELTPRTH